MLAKTLGLLTLHINIAAVTHHSQFYVLRMQPRPGRGGEQRKNMTRKQHQPRLQIDNTRRPAQIWMPKVTINATQRPKEATTQLIITARMKYK